uniref:Uncharacterized protein n=1 Tax=Anopheles quadriannulatus TaxID=34691 RepID=A0A182XTA6_ANOQN
MSLPAVSLVTKAQDCLPQSDERCALLHLCHRRRCRRGKIDSTATFPCIYRVCGLPLLTDTRARTRQW